MCPLCVVHVGAHGAPAVPACTYLVEPLRRLLRAGAPAILALIVLLAVTRCHATAASEECDGVELFAGDASVSRGLTAAGFRMLTLDIRYMAGHPKGHAMDLLTPAGFACVA